MGADKKEDMLGAVAIKPEGWDRTGWEAFRYFIYDPNNGTVLSRTPKSWALITIFYTIYYSCLAAFWYVCLLIFFSTLPDAAAGPKWQQENSLIGINPGVGIRPLNRDARIDSNMFMLQQGETNKVPTTPDGEGDLNIDYAVRAENFMKVYAKASGDDYLDFDTATLGPCENSPYGYVGDEVTPCVFLKFNKIWGWNPTPITEEDFTAAADAGNPGLRTSRLTGRLRETRTRSGWTAREGTPPTRKLWPAWSTSPPPEGSRPSSSPSRATRTLTTPLWSL